jgi:hypothetical protein
MARIAVPRPRRKHRSPLLSIAALAAVVPAVSGSAALAREATEGTPSAAPVTTAAQGTIDATVESRKVFFGGPRAVLSYVVGGSEPADVQVELMRVADGAVVRRWALGMVEPGAARALRWDGTIGGEVQPDGAYEFRVAAVGASGTRATSGAPDRPHALEAPGAWASLARAAADEPETAFRFLRHHFPIAGAHRYGVAGARFGGGRGHQGQDVFADCGTPIVAARGGVVKFKQFEGAAGNYVVIDGTWTGTDYAYMHMRKPARVDEGDHVETGQVIGRVGATGRADGCHLHFEEWTAPGWYSGGHAFDPLRDLRGWDAQS